MDNRLLLSKTDAARQLSIGIRLLQSITEPRGPLPAIRIGTRVLYSPVDLEHFIESQKSATSISGTHA